MENQNNITTILPSWKTEVTLEDIFKGKYSLNKKAINNIRWETLSYFINGNIKKLFLIYYGDKVKIYKAFVVGEIDKKEEEGIFVYIVDDNYITIISKYRNGYGDWDYARDISLRWDDCSKEVFELMKGIVEPSRFLKLFKREHPYLISVIKKRREEDTEFLTEDTFLRLIGKELNEKLLRGEDICPKAWESLNPNEANAILLKEFVPLEYYRRNTFKYNYDKDKKGKIELSTEGKIIEIEIDIQEEKIKLYYEYCPDRWEEPSLIWKSCINKKDFPSIFSYILYFINGKLEEIKNKKGVEDFREDIKKYFPEA